MDDVVYPVPATNDKKYTEEDREAQRRIELAARHISLYAVVPARYSSKICEDSCLKIFEKHDKDAIEVVTREPQCIGLNLPALLLPPLAAVPLFISFVLNVYFVRNTAQRLLWLFLAVDTALITAAIRFKFRGVEERKTRFRLTRFFTTFSHIETLVLDDFLFEKHPFLSILGDALKTLGKLQIDRLEIRVKDVDNYTFDKIIKMCRTHNAREVFIQTRKLIATNFSNFVVEFAKLGVTLDIYEISCSRFKYYLHKSRDDWTKLEKVLNADGVSMRMTTIHDDTFKSADYPFGVKMHLRCDKKTNEEKMALEPVHVGRGFRI